MLGPVQPSVHYGPIVGGAESVSGPSPFDPAPTNLRPLYVVRRRLEERGLWVALSHALIGAPDKMLTLLSTESPGMVDVTDPDVISMIRLIGADPAEILA